jgi:heme/copper-type cytochrome/quinol oxidase subunit 2
MGRSRIYSQFGRRTGMKKEPMGNKKQVYALGVGLSILLLIPVWWFYGALFAEEVEHGEDGHGGMEGMGMGMSMGGKEKVTEFKEEVEDYIRTHDPDDDGVIEADAGHELPVLAQSFSWRPDRIEVEAGKEYRVRFLSADVTHGFVLQFGDSRLLKELDPGTEVTLSITFKESGEYLATCGFYCGVGHGYMNFKIYVVPPGEGYQYGGGHYGEVSSMEGMEMEGSPMEGEEGERQG